LKTGMLQSWSGLLISNFNFRFSAPHNRG